MARSRKKKKVELISQPDPKAPLDSQAFLDAAKPVLARLTEDLLERADASPAVTRAMKARHTHERATDLTAADYATWRRNVSVQIAAAWLLSCVFVRILEDRGLLRRNRIAGQQGADSQHDFFHLAPHLTEREYLMTVFREISHFPAAADLFDPRHNLLWRLGPSAEATKDLLQLFRSPQVDAPAFRFGQQSTRFLGDLYQDLSEDVRKRYALLQTPEFVEEFILSRTLDPAIDEFGLENTDLIDPTCGSGHFLLGAFDRLFDRRLHEQPGIATQDAAQKALDAVAGIDINPYAVGIARFRLTLSFLEKAGFADLEQAPRVEPHVAAADSLLHNYSIGQADIGDLPETESKAWKGEEFALEDDAAAKAILQRSYAAVVGNPPYITVKDKALRERYRARYRAAAGKYAMSAPFMERFFQLGRRGGYVGQITANSFMKREFGKNLVQETLPKLDVQLIVNTAGAYIPGHGTPTVLVFGRNNRPEGEQVAAVLAKRGEPATPEDASQGLVWASIRDHWSEVGFENDYISVENAERSQLAEHPWSLEGGGAGQLKALLEARANGVLSDIAVSTGISCVTGEDDVFLLHPGAWDRLGVHQTRPLVVGELVRDWALASASHVLFPYDSELGLCRPADAQRALRHLWPYKTTVSRRKRFGVPMIERGLAWYELQELYADKLRTPLTIVFAFVSTHNHFALDRNGEVFNRTAPIIKLPESATEDDHLALLAYLNSSTACFWMKQVCHRKTSASQKHHTDPARAAYEFTGTALEPAPIFDLPPEATRAAAELHRLGELRAQWISGEGMRPVLDEAESADTIEAALSDGWSEYERARDRALYLQEELDWAVYVAAGLVECDQIQIDLNVAIGAAPGSRPFEAEKGYDAGLSERVSAGVGANTTGTLARWRDRLPLLDKRELRILESREYKRMWRDTERNVSFEAFRHQLEERWIA